MVGLRIFFPDMWVKTVADIDLEALVRRGIRGLILDVDNTLAAYKQRCPEVHTRAFADRAQKAGLKLRIVSNNFGARVGTFARELGISAYPLAFKPLRHKLLRASRDMALSPQAVAVVGDQIFTDIYGGNRCQMMTILVDPVAQKESLLYRVRRQAERWVLSQWEREKG